MARVRGFHDVLDGLRRVRRVKDRTRQQREHQRVVGADDSCVEELLGARVELCARLVIERGHHHLGSAPDVDEKLASGARWRTRRARALEEPPVRALERCEPHAVRFREGPFDAPCEAPARHGVAPERPTALLEPRVLGRESSRTRLERRAQFGHAPGAVAAELDDPRRSLEHSHSARAGVLCRDPARMENRIFFPQTALDEWIVEGTAELQDGELTLLETGRRYRLAEAVHVVRDASGGGDPELVGRVKARIYLEQLGAEIVESSMLLGDAAYDVEPGWIGVPATAFADFVAARARAKISVGSVGSSDEELLAKFALKSA